MKIRKKILSVVIAAMLIVIGGFMAAGCSRGGSGDAGGGGNGTGGRGGVISSDSTQRGHPVCAWKKIGSDHLLTGADGTSPSLYWTGSEYGVSWYGDGDRDGILQIYFTRVSPTGAKLGFSISITNDSDQSWGDPSISWTGSEFGVSWIDNRNGKTETYFARVSATGAKLGSDLRISRASNTIWFPSLCWTGSEFGVSWVDSRDGNEEIYFARISAAGTKLGSDLRVTSDGCYSRYPSLSWTGAQFGVSWEDERDGNAEIYLARVSAGGVKIGSDLRVTSNEGHSGSPSLSWTGSEFGVSWSDGRSGNGKIYFARVSVGGVKIGSDLRVTSNEGGSGNPYLCWTGSEFGVSWVDYRDGNPAIYFTRISAAGAKLGSDLRVTNASNSSNAPSLSWTGSEFGVSWHDLDMRNGNTEIHSMIYFARIGEVCE